MNWEIAGNTLLRETRKGLGTCPSTSKPTCTLVIGSGGFCIRLSKFLTGGIRIASFYKRRLNCLNGFDFERGKVSRRSDYTCRYFYNSLKRKWLERAWFEKYGISWHISVLLRKSDSRLQWQGFIHVIPSCIIKTNSAIMQNVFCSVKA